MANTFVTQQKVLNTFLLLLKNSLVMGKLVAKDLGKEYTNETVAVGSTVKVRRPPEFTVRSGATLAAQDIQTGSVDVTIDTQLGVDIALTSQEETLNVDDLLKNQTMKSKAAALAQEIDSRLMDRALEFPHWVGTPGQKIDAASDFFVGVQRSVELGIPQDDVNAVLSPNDHFGLASAFTGLAASDQTVRTAIEKAQIPMLGGVTPYLSQNVKNLVTGNRAGTPLVNGASQSVAYSAVRTNYQQSLILDGLGASQTVKRGEVFTIAGVNAVNPRSKADLGYLQKFVVLADATADGSGNITLTIANPIITSGAYQTVTAAPADNAAITFMGSASTAYAQNAIFHRNAIAFASVKLSEPKSGKWSYATDAETGISLRIWEQSDINNDQHFSRIDILMGTVCLDRRLGVRVSGT